MGFKTTLTDRLNLKHPVVAAPLGRGSTPEFLGALANAGALGFVALGHIPEAELRQTLSGYIASAGGADRFGINFVLIADHMQRLETALDAGCRVVSFLRGDPAPYVSGSEEAKRAADCGVDFIMAQGREAGGHLTGEAPLMTLLPTIVDSARGVPVVAAGGIADGRGLAAALSLGACGAWMGTRFVASAESGSHPGHKQMIVDCGLSDLVETTLFDGGWPNSPHRVIANSTYKNWKDAGYPSNGSRPGEGEAIGQFSEGVPMLRYNVATPWATMDGDWEAGPLYAGLSATLIQAVKPVGELLAQIDDEAENALRKNVSYLRV